MAIAARISTITVTTPIPLRMPPPFDTPTVPRGCEAVVKTGGRCEGGPGYTVAAQTSQAAYAASTNTPSTRPARPRATNTVATTAYRAATPRNATDPAASISSGRTSAARPRTPVVNAASVPNRLPVASSGDPRRIGRTSRSTSSRLTRIPRTAAPTNPAVRPVSRTNRAPPATRSAAPPATATRPPTVRRMAGPADGPARAGSSSRFDRPSRRTSPTYAP